MDDENPPVRIPDDEDGVDKIAAEGEEPRVTEEQRRNIAVTCAKLIGDIDPDE